MSYTGYAYAKVGAVIGGLIGLTYGVFDGLQDAQNLFTETLEYILDNEMSSNPYLPYLVAASDTLFGTMGGSGLGVLIRIYLRFKKKEG